MDANYPMSPEQIGQPDPLAPDYVGTYSPQAEYKIDVIAEALSAR